MISDCIQLFLSTKLRLLVGCMRGYYWSKLHFDKKLHEQRNFLRFKEKNNRLKISLNEP